MHNGPFTPLTKFHKSNPHRKKVDRNFVKKSVFEKNDVKGDKWCKKYFWFLNILAKRVKVV